MSITPNIKRGKRCLVACPPDRCDCEAADVPPGYWEALMKAFRAAPLLHESPDEPDIEPYV